jgi:hypothetical protein
MSTTLMLSMLHQPPAKRMQRRDHQTCPRNNSSQSTQSS